MNEKFDTCLNAASGIIDMVIYDMSRDLNPVSVRTPSFIISNHSIMVTFAPKPYHEIEGSCALYCKDVCYHTVNIATLVDELYGKARL